MNDSQPIDDLLAQATAALTRLDADALGELELRARQLQVLLSTRGHAYLEAPARMRVFAGVLRETGETLRVLQQVRG